MEEKNTSKPKAVKALGILPKYVLIGLIWMAVLLLIPQLTLGIVILNLVVMALITGLQFYSVLLPKRVPLSLPRQDQPFVSIHIPTYNEPPHIVIETLKALTQLQYENYEVIILDNNTKDKAVWQPVETYCNTLGPKFRFFHIDKLDGYKAGALNVCYEKSNPRTSYILVIDADYQVHPKLLKESLSYFTDPSIALVQFPQSYMNAGESNQGLHGEYDHFFEVYMNMADHLNCVLSTGTVSVISRKALHEVGLWADSTITEDVEMGLRLHQKGYRGVYVHKPLGKGLMPTDVEALKVQRERWVYGNMQTLILFFRLSKNKLSLVQCAGIITQLTAWFNFLLVPATALLTVLIADRLTEHPLYLVIESLSLASIWAFLLIKLVFFIISFQRCKRSLRCALQAFAVHLGLSWEGAFSWVRYLLNDQMGFKRTNKYPTLDKLSKTLPSLFFMILLAASALLFLLEGNLALAALCLLAAPPFASILYVRELTRRTSLLGSTPNKPF